MVEGETGFEIWAREFLSALRIHGVARFADLPELEKARLHVLAAGAWPAMRRQYEQAGEISRGLTPEQLEQVAPQILPEMDISSDEMVQLANYRTAIRALEALWEIAGDRSTPHPLGYVIRALDQWSPE